MIRKFKPSPSLLESPDSYRIGGEAHLLVIRLSALGDVAMTVPVIRAFAAQHPGVKITILSRGFFKPMFADIPNLNFYEADVKGKHKGFLGLWKLFKELKDLKVDAVADLHNVLRSNVLKRFFSWKGIPVVQIDKGRTEKKALTGVKDKVFEQLKTTHQRYADVFETLGFKVDLNQHEFPKRKNLTSKIHAIIGSDVKKWIGIAPFAAFEGKMYPLDLMEKVIANLDGANSFKVILFGGGKKEREILNNLSAKYKNAVSVVGKLSFDEELALISNLDLMVSMDSGNAHLAAMYGVKTITLWGVTHPFAGFYPFAQDKGNALLANREQFPLIPTSVYGNKFPEGYENAMRSIAPNNVIDKINKTLNSPLERS